MPIAPDPHGIRTKLSKTFLSRVSCAAALGGTFFLLCLSSYAAGPQQAAAGRGAAGGTPTAPQSRQLDPTAVERGKQSFGVNCAFCHGADARGALAPDLARSLYVLNDDHGEGLGPFLKTGIPDKGMPSFAQMTDAQITDLATFLHSVVADALKRPGMDNNAIIVGDAKAGESYFNGAGKCGTCHSPTGDFKGIGSKYDAATLQDRMVSPRGGRGAPPPAPSTVKVTLPSGQTVSGRLVSVNDFSVTLIDSNGARKSFPRDNDMPKVEITDPLQAHLDMYLKYTDKNMHDLTAYLVTLK